MDNTLSESSQQFITDEKVLSDIIAIVEDLEYRDYQLEDLSAKLDNDDYYSFSMFEEEQPNT